MRRRLPGTCTSCGEKKPQEAFWRDARGYNGYSARCINCCKAIKNARYEHTGKGLLWLSQQKRRLASSVYDSDGKLESRICRRCNIMKDVSEFYHDRKYDCKPCEVIYNRFARHHITELIYNQMRQDQNYCCAICGDLETDPFSLVIDHDHRCCPDKGQQRGKSCGKCIRGLTCSPCNIAVGMIRDNPKVALQMAEYLILNKRLDPENVVGACRVSLTL